MTANVDSSEGRGGARRTCNPPFVGQQGYQHDNELDLCFAATRHLDPAIGRWICQDPQRWQAGDVNLYRYVHNNLVLDDLQFTFDLIGLIPIVGAPFDIVSAGISAGRGNPVAASISLLAIASDAGGVAKVARRADAGMDALKLSQKADDNVVGHS